MELQSALLLLGGLGLLTVGLLVAFFVFRKTIKTTKTFLLAGLIGVGVFVLIMIVTALLAGRG
ncbi:MAG: hypothetical protein JXA14_03365 [Anaerolineae bacterium]|nr:hypothetical protein [Anaerolineae bacterium]